MVNAKGSTTDNAMRPSLAFVLKPASLGLVAHVPIFEGPALNTRQAKVKKNQWIHIDLLSSPILQGPSSFFPTTMSD